ncbi:MULTISPECIES: hypothetical protein [unclassified Streptomyces]|uniref:hypothetical protein n=1 Tax=unclassified Streptomyces TaxID=2593676 RepID=UPI00382097BB
MVGHPTRDPVLRGEDTVMVRPYLVAYEQRQLARRRLEPHPRTFRIAVHGVDIGAGAIAR